jgi:hypothetical protein
MGGPHHPLCAALQGAVLPMTAAAYARRLSFRVLRDDQQNERRKTMGLDMYARTTSEAVAGAVDFEVKEASNLHYWRKHPNLHGWMEALYREKGGSADTFDCVPVVLTAADLDRLEADVKAGNLPHTSGFFFGESDGSEADGDLAFIAKARQALAAGLTVFYDSWW